MTTNLLSHPVLKDYLTDKNSYDELLGEDGKLRPHWEIFFHTYCQLGNDEIFSRNNDILRLLKENGVTYNIYDDPSGFSRPWQLDLIPFLINKNEWADY